MERTAAFVWRRSDFRESSRIVTLLTRAAGKVRVLAKGAHRHDSPLLGKIDLLNLVEVNVSGRGELKLLGRVRLLEDRRALREPVRFLAASWLVELVDAALPDGPGDPGLFDLVQGAVHLLEKCPKDSLPLVVLGCELRFLAVLGLLPPLQLCSECEAPAQRVAPDRRSLRCNAHAEGSGEAADARTLGWLAALAAAPGRTWPELPRCPDRKLAERVVGGFVAGAIERTGRLRRHALALA